ncbi:MAG: hypothetical protein J6X97_08650 [Lachnospiraceae bacterium]|nr:hypothetical protein [Lachnospiraceae bacterium]
MIRIFIRLLVAYISIQIRLVLFLMKHFDITNSLLTGLFADMLLGRLNLYIWIRIGIVIVIAVICFLLQHFFIPARIIISAFSCFICGAIAYAVFKDNEVFSPYIPMVIVASLTGVLNWICWKNRMKLLKMSDE